MEIDDRGVIYVRHGEPAERLRPFVYGLMPNESWRFNRAEGDLLLHFSAGYDTNGGGDLYDYRLVESVLDLRGASDAPDGPAPALPGAPLRGVPADAPLGAVRRRPLARPGAGNRPGEYRRGHDDRQLRAPVPL